MHIIVLASQKGGSGKSTLTVGIAIAAAGDGHRVAIIDTDPQGTVSNWGRRRTAPEPYIHRLGSDIELERPLLAFRQTGFTLAIIDTPAGVAFPFQYSMHFLGHLSPPPERESPKLMERCCLGLLGCCYASGLGGGDVGGTGICRLT